LRSMEDRFSRLAKENLQATVFLARTMADENRLRIIHSLADGEKPVSRIVEELGISQPLASHHLKELKRSLLVTVERNGFLVAVALVAALIPARRASVVDPVQALNCE